MGWTAMNKIIPALYNNFSPIPRNAFDNNSALGTIAVGLIMGWGSDTECEELYSEDLMTQVALRKVGYTINNTDEILPFRLALTKAVKGYFYKLNKGGEKATVTIGGIKYTAKYTGIVGNRIGITQILDTPQAGKTTINILVDGQVKEIKIIANASEITGIISNWVDAETVGETPAIIASTNTLLEGGTNGTVTDASYTSFFEAIRYKQFNVVTIMGADTTISDKLIDFVNYRNSQRGAYITSVVYNKPALDNDAIISVNQGLECDDFTITTDLFPIAIGSLRAGCPLGESLTDENLTEIFGARKIINALDDSTDTAKENAINQGMFCVHYINDGSVRVLKDINTFISVTDEKPKYYTKNTTIQTLYYILNEEDRVAHDGRLGKYTNTQIKRDLLAAAFLDVFKDAQQRGAIAPYDSTTDMIIQATDDPDTVLVNQKIKVRGNIEYIYITTYTDISTE